MDICKYFKDITGFNSPYSFQIELTEKIISGKNVIMQAPTGSGKTWASIVPFLIAKKENLKFPKKLIYILPLRTLANSLYSEIQENDFIKNNEIKVTIQTGEQNDDPYFLEGDIIFTTIDQVLSSLLCISFSVSQRQGNINVGAILTSYLVFDEFHLLDPSTSLSTTFHLLKKFKKITPFCLMTATLSNKLLETMCKTLKTERVVVDEEKLLEIKSQREKKRYVNVLNSVIDADTVLKNHKQLSIVICNTVDRTQKLYFDLELAMKGKSEFKNTKLICINSRFTSKDRKKIENRIRELYKKGSKANAILISTQIIEVGLDISCDTMHTEISQINSFLQRIGRCARYEKEEGKIFVYDVVKENKKMPYAPYNKELCIETYNELEKIQGINLDYFTSQKLIDDILTELELKNILEIKGSCRDKEIKECWIDPHKRFAKELIREIDTVSVIVCNNPYKIQNPYRIDAISISRYSLKGKLSKIVKENEDDWIIKVVEEDNMIFDLSDEKRYTFPSIGIDNSQLEYDSLFILNSKYVSYSNKIGFNFMKIGEEKVETLDNKKDKKIIEMKKETYCVHIERMILAYNDLLLNKCGYAFDKLKVNYIVDIDEIIRFMIVMHDYGKLSVKWQEFAREWQMKLGDDCSEQLLAHTNQSEEMQNNRKPPHHSGAGAVVVSKLLPNSLGGTDDVFRISIAVTTAILKHHGLAVHTSNSYNIEEKGKKEVLRLLKLYCNNLFSKIDINEVTLEKSIGKSLDNNICDFGDRHIAALYFILVRILRICDQKSFEYAE